MSVSALVTAFEIEFARAYVDSFTQSSEELTRRIGMVEETMPKMMDTYAERGQGGSTTA